jgi:hypothetical protein
MRKSALAARAIVAGALADDLAFDGILALKTGISLAFVDQQFLGEITRIALRVDEVAQGGAAAPDGVGQDVADGWIPDM